MRPIGSWARRTCATGFLGLFVAGLAATLPPATASPGASIPAIDVFGTPLSLGAEWPFAAEQCTPDATRLNHCTMTVHGHQVDVAALWNGGFIYGIALDITASSDAAAWTAFWGPNATVRGAPRGSTTTAGACGAEAPKGAVGCQCRRQGYGPRDTPITVAEEVCDLDGDISAQTYVMFGGGADSEAPAMHAAATMARARGDVTGALLLADGVLRLFPGTREGVDAWVLGHQLGLVGSHAPAWPDEGWHNELRPTAHPGDLTVVAVVLPQAPKTVLESVDSRLREAMAWGAHVVVVERGRDGGAPNPHPTTWPVVTVTDQAVLDSYGATLRTWSSNGLSVQDRFPVAVVRDGRLLWCGPPTELGAPLLTALATGTIAPKPWMPPHPATYAASSTEWADAVHAVEEACHDKPQADCEAVLAELNGTERNSLNRCNGTLVVPADIRPATLTSWTCNGGATVELTRGPSGWVVGKFYMEESGD
jgi:hypothetical protein